MAYDDLIRSALRTHWHVRPSGMTEARAGWMSRAWELTVDGDDYFVRLYAEDIRQPVEAGLVACEQLRGHGFEIGTGVRTLAGTLIARTPMGALALVHRIPGRLLEPADPLDQQWWGDRLGVAHNALQGFTHPGLRRWGWLHADGQHLSVEPWVRQAVADAVAAMIRLTVTDRLTFGVLHGDPAPSAFVVDRRTGRTGVLDWGPCGAGPLAYDLAAAVAYAGGPDRAGELVDGYRAAGPVPPDEIEVALPVLLRFRWAVQADWYARRIDAAGRTPDITAPGADPAADRKGLHEARDALGAIAAGGGP